MPNSWLEPSGRSGGVLPALPLEGAAAAGEPLARPVLVEDALVAAVPVDAEREGVRRAPPPRGLVEPAEEDAAPALVLVDGEAAGDGEAVLQAPLGDDERVPGRRDR